MTMINISRAASLYGASVPVSINGSIREIPVGVDVDVPAEYIEVLKARGQTYRLSASPEVPPGFVLLDGTGAGAPVGINGKVTYLPYDVPIQITPEQNEVIVGSAALAAILSPAGGTAAPAGFAIVTSAGIMVTSGNEPVYARI